MKQRIQRTYNLEPGPDECFQVCVSRRAINAKGDLPVLKILQVKPDPGSRDLDKGPADQDCHLETGREHRANDLEILGPDGTVLVRVVHRPGNVIGGASVYILTDHSIRYRLRIDDPGPAHRHDTDILIE